MNNVDYIQGLVNGSPNLLIAIDTAYIIMVTNKNYSDFSEKVYGKTPVIGDKFGEILSTDKNDSVMNQMIDGFTTALRGERKTDVYKLSQGKLANIYFEATFYTIRNKALEIIGAACMAKDVTELETSILSLKSMTNIFSLASKLAKLAPWRFDIESNVFIFNEEIYSLYGTSVEKEGITMSLEVFTNRIVYIKDRPMVKEFFDKVLKSRELEQTIEFESRITRLDNGQIRIIKVLTKIIRDQSRKILEFYGTNQDVTEQREMENKLKEKMVESEKFNKLFVDRENKMIELKNEIEELKKKSG